jgi:hypothetical protein
MKESPGLLKLGTPIITHEALDTTSGLMVHGKHIEARRPNAKGTIAGIVGGHGGDTYWVKHDDEQVAAYGWQEFELDQGDVPALQPLINEHAGNPRKAEKLFRYMRQYIKDCHIKGERVDFLPAYVTGLRAMRKHQPDMAAILEIEAQGLRRLGEEEPLFLHDLTSKETLASATAKALAGRRTRTASPRHR